MRYSGHVFSRIIFLASIFNIAACANPFAGQSTCVPHHFNATDSGWIPNQLPMEAESDGFGWQWLGSVQDKARLLRSCWSFEKLYQKRLLDAGLNDILICDVWCNGTAAPRLPAPVSVLPNITFAWDEIFANRTLRAAGDGKSVNHTFASVMCKNLNGSLLDQMGLSRRSLNTICRTSGHHPPATKDDAFKLDSAVSLQLKSLQSKLFASKLMLLFNERKDIKIWCYQASNAHAKLKGLGLDPMIVESTVCSDENAGLPSVETLVNKISHFMSLIFGTQLLHASQVDSHRQFVCSSVEDQGLNGTSLQPAVVKNILCNPSSKIIRTE